MTLTVAGRPATSGTISIPYAGAWVADLDLDTAAELAGVVEVQLGPMVLTGTVDPTASGAYNASSRVRVVGGANGWGRAVAPKGYHNDAGVRRSLVARDAGRAVGETVDVAASVDGVMGADFQRGAGPASRVLRQALPGVPWWVDFDGVTHVGPRAETELDVEHTIIDADPRHGTAVLATERPDRVIPGVVLTQGLAAPLIVRDVAHVVDAKASRVFVWGGAAEAPAENRLVRALSALASEAHPRAPYAFPYRYRVVEMVVDRVVLQAVRRAAGLPDALAVSVWPGMAGLSAELTPGAVVLVQFIEGDASLPVITHHSPKGSGAFRPVTVAIDASGTVEVGASADSVSVGAGAARVIREGDNVTVGTETGPIAFVNPLDPTLTRVLA